MPIHAATPAQPAPTATLAQRSPHDWAVLAAQDEVRAITHDSSLIRYRVHTIDDRGDRTRQVVECTGGHVARLIAKDGKPLTPEEDAAERQRLQALAASPDDFARHTKNEVSGKKLAVSLIQLMPDAMIYTPAPAQPAPRAPNSAPNGAPLIVLDFAPNPAWTPPNTTAEGLTGLRGRMWIDPESGYVVRMQGEIFRPVNFGWGMVAHIYPGGKLSLDQVNVGSGRWIYSHFEQHLRLRALLLKTIDVDSSTDTSNYQPLPSLISWQQAIQLLLR